MWARKVTVMVKRGRLMMGRVGDANCKDLKPTQHRRYLLPILLLLDMVLSLDDNLRLKNVLILADVASL